MGSRRSTCKGIKEKEEEDNDRTGKKACQLYFFILVCMRRHSIDHLSLCCLSGTLEQRSTIDSHTTYIQRRLPSSSSPPPPPSSSSILLRLLLPPPSPPPSSSSSSRLLRLLHPPPSFSVSSSLSSFLLLAVAYTHMHTACTQHIAEHGCVSFIQSGPYDSRYISEFMSREAGMEASISKFKNLLS